MATINQIKKQIETANGRLAKYEKNASMYDVRATKAIERAKKATGKEFDRANYSFVLSDRNEWELKYSIESNLESYYENCKKIQNEKTNIERLTNVLDEMEVESRPSNLIEPLNAAMVEFKSAWFERMMAWFGNYYDNIQKALPEAKSRYNRARRIEDAMSWRYNWNHYLRKITAAVRASAAEIISDKAARMFKVEFLSWKRAEMEETWNGCVAKLASKCEKFGLDESAIKVSKPQVTAKGFQCFLTDGTNRVIDARMIWAAEYSDIVSPHTRYIVTERRK